MMTIAASPSSYINPLLSDLRPSATVAINEHSDRLRQEGRSIYKFGLGQSPFPVPSVVVQALREHAGEKDYLPVQGLLPLRETVAQYHSVSDKVSYEAEGVIIGPGSKELMFILQLALRAELLIPAPSWVSYAPQAQIAGTQCHYLPCEREDDLRLRAEGLDRFCKENPGQAQRLLILNYPNNPTGMSYPSEEIQKIAEVCRRHSIILLSDEIYGGLHHTGEHESVSQYYPEGTIISGGLSKWCGAGGWRLGTFVLPRELYWLLRPMLTIASETFTSVSAPIQYAAIRAYQHCEEMQEYLQNSRALVRALGAYCVEKIREVGGICSIPDGGFYLFPDFSGLRESLRGRGVASSPQLSHQLLEKAGVALLPGSAFGRPEEELSLRMAYVDFDGEKALAAMKAGANLSEAFLKEYCPQVVSGMEALCSYFSE